MILSITRLKASRPPPKIRAGTIAVQAPVRAMWAMRSAAGMRRKRWGMIWVSRSTRDRASRQVVSTRWVTVSRVKPKRRTKVT